MDKDLHPQIAPLPHDIVPQPHNALPSQPGTPETGHHLLHGLRQKARIALMNIVGWAKETPGELFASSEYPPGTPEWMIKPATEFTLPEQKTTPMRTLEKTPSFTKLLEEARAGMWKKPISYSPATLTLNGTLNRGDEEKDTESDIIVDLDTFLAQAEEAAEYSGDHRATESIKRSRTELPFLTHEAFKTATQGIANEWQEYLRGDPNRKIFLYYPPSTKNKSNTYVSNAILAKATEGDEFVGRVVPLRIGGIADLPDALKSMNASDARIVLADDWVGDGTQMRRAMGILAHDLISRHRGDLIASIEMDLLLTHAAQANYGMSFDIGQNAVTVKSLAYYVAPDISDSLGIRPFGAHGSNDRNYELFSQFADMIRQHTNRDVALPKATYILPPYKK